MTEPQPPSLEEALRRLADERQQDLAALDSATDDGDMPDLRQAFEQHMATHTAPAVEDEPSSGPRLQLLRFAPYLAAAIVLMVAGAALWQGVNRPDPSPPNDLGPTLANTKIELLAIEGDAVELRLGSGDTDGGFFYYELTVDAGAEPIVGPLTVLEDITTIEVPGVAQLDALNVHVRLLENDGPQGERDRWTERLLTDR